MFCIQNPTGNISAGVPQGSILGPLLFLIYINHLPLCITESDKLIYADDTTLAAVGHSIEEIENDLSTDVEHTSDWCGKNDMVISLPKSISMIVASRQKLFHACKLQSNVSLEIKLDDDDIPCATKTKILGVLRLAGEQYLL